MAEKKLKVVVAGCGGMANGWVQNATQIPALHVVGLVDLRREAAVAMAAKYQLPSSVVFSSLEEALQQTQPDIVFDVTVPGAHYDVTMAALRAGCHVLGEKPLSDTLAHAKEMVALAKKTGKVYAIMQNRRYEPNIRAVRQCITQDRIGEVAEIHADFFIGAHFGGFRDQMEDVLIVDMAIHTFDAARYLSGTDPVSVYCHSFNPKHSWYKGHASAICIFGMSDGVGFCYRGSWCSEGLHTPWEASWRVVGSRGSILWDGAAGIQAQALKQGGKHGFFSEMANVPVQIEPMEHTAHAALIRDYVQCLQARRMPMTTCEDNIKSLAMVMAAVESRKTGKKIEIKW